MVRYGFVLKTAARQEWFYQAEVLLRAGQMALFMGVFMALWSTAFGVSGQRALAGYSLAGVVWYLGMTETIVLSSSRIFAEISEAVKAGDLVYALARPLSYPFFQVATSLGNTLPRFVLNWLTAAVVVSLGLGHLPVVSGVPGSGSLPGLLAFAATAALALLLDALVVVLIGLAAFWIEETAPLYWIYQKLLFTVGGMFLPLEMFPDWLQPLARWLPFQLITYAPARAFVAFDLDFVVRAALGQAAYIGVLSALVVLVWRRAQRRLVVHGG